MTNREPADGTAIVLHLIEAARDWRTGAFVTSDEGPELGTLARWVDALEERYAREQPAPEPVGWEPRRWREVVDGDRVTMGGVEALVIGAPVTHHWHVDPKSSEYRPAPLEHAARNVRLRWTGPDGAEQEKVYPMPPGGEVECLRGPAGQEADRAAGHRSVLEGERVDVLEHWAGEAVAILELAGLGPVEVI